MTHRPTGGLTAPLQTFCVAYPYMNDAVTAACVALNSYRISCPYLWFVGDYIVHKPSDASGRQSYCLLGSTVTFSHSIAIIKRSWH